MQRRDVDDVLSGPARRVTDITAGGAARPGTESGLESVKRPTESDDNVFVKEERVPAPVEAPAPVKAKRISCCGLIY